jgi:integrase
VLWHQDGRQRSLTFENLSAAERFKALLEDHGPDEALRIIELDEIGRHVPTVTEWLYTHIDALTGVLPATLGRYRTYVARDIDPVFGSKPVTAMTETTIARWVKQLAGSGKTIANKRGFLSGALNAAVRAGVLASNPCHGRRLPHTRVEETVFLTPEDFRLLRDHIVRDRWKNLATWLVTTGMRFSEATALIAADIDAAAKTCRINKAWKYSGDYRPEIGPPKGPAVRGGVGAMFLGGVVADRMGAHKGALVCQLYRSRHDRHLELLSPPRPSGRKPRQDAPKGTGVKAGATTRSAPGPSLDPRPLTGADCSDAGNDLDGPRDPVALQSTYLNSFVKRVPELDSTSLRCQLLHNFKALAGLPGLGSTMRRSQQI